MDLAVARAAAGWRSPAVGLAGELFTLIFRGDLLILAALAAAGAAFLSGRRGLALALTLLLPMTATEVICKHLIAVPPEATSTLNPPLDYYLPVTGALRPFTLATPYTFPSGHVARIMFLSGLALATRPRRPWPVLTVTLLVVGLGGFTRLTEAQHLISDVFGGGLLAVMFLCLALVLLDSDRARASTTRHGEPGPRHQRYAAIEH